MTNTPTTFGHFSEDGLEYVITDPLAPPRAQINFLWNDHIISGLNQFGSGEGIFNDRTLMLNHPKGRVQLIRHGRRYFYLQDRESGAFWSAGLFPVNKEGGKLVTRVGLGYSVFEMEDEGVRTVSKCFLAPDEPVEIWEFEVTNQTDRARQIRLAPFVEFHLGGYATFSSPYSYLRSTFDAERNAVLSYNTSDERPHERYNAFLATDRKVDDWCGGRRDFFGPYGDAARPQALKDGMACREAWVEELAGSLGIDFDLQPGETQTCCVIIGSFDSDAEKDRLIGKVLDADYRAKAFAELAAQKQTMIDTVRVETPDERINLLTNIWSKQQIQLCVEFGRDGARGFRDTLQDAWGTAPFNPALAREKIIETLRHQHADGHAVRGWLPLQPHHYSDGPVWIPLAICGYLKETGDLSLLDEVVPYLDEGEATVLEHTLTGLRHLSEDLGEHGLCLAHEGDWNDSLNWMGRAGKGESVWTSIGLHYGLTAMIELADEVLKDAALATELRDRQAKIEAAIEEHGWDGEWYLAGYSDFGNAVGSQENAEGKVFLNPQTWAILAGLAKGERREACLKAIDEQLESDHGSLTLTPAYNAKDENVGRVTMLLPGMYENGTPYCHGTAFKIVMDCVAGRPDEGLHSYRKVMPDTPEHPSLISGCEPYAFTNQYLGPDNGRAGESISGWITGSAGWMFRSIVDYFCGVQPGYAGVDITPCLPTEWDNVKVDRMVRGKLYAIEIRREGEGYAITVNGEACPDGFVPYAEAAAPVA
ncbi:GH36-type glycosyl hydrolase domain-containing protein [Cerasicoccus maritimus]|uniref:GH36-type glycosyl hydrolase domain-containing protein n=1 Tax=Cerasicoccus maritimus TaxID=490089 RepID=UPI00285293A7|nr:hypothetical protein [Cerasicoccus maritimus]